MTFVFDQKEELRVRMADLEKKLTESEEERYKLEKTCNVLMRAFREEEKSRYNALNKKYEKFLQDCLVRRRRNDIILRTLYRVEDRSKALFAKTERLKLLKDRYVSYLKKDEISIGASGNFPFLTQKPVCDVTLSSSGRNSSLPDHKLENVLGQLQVEEGFTGREPIVNYVFNEKREVQKADEKKNELSHVYEVSPRISSHPNRVDIKETEAGGHGPQIKPLTLSQGKNPVGSSNSKERNLKEDLIRSLSEVTALRERGVKSHEESFEELRQAISVEKDTTDLNEQKFLEKDTSDSNRQKFLEKDDIELSEKEIFFRTSESFSGKNHPVLTSSPKGSTRTEEKASAKPKSEDDLPNDTETPRPLPKGLDGVDYQNETYPESYYEQPVHRHNHLSIASDVILEEDETEVEEDPKEPDTGGNVVFGKSSQEEPRKSPDDWERDSERSKEYFGFPDITKGQESAGSRSSAFFGDEHKSSKSERVLPDGGSKAKSNLIHMLESDSESFQIEHGPEVSANEDSDFDFSFQDN